MQQPPMSPSSILVAAGVLRDSRGRILLARRPDRAHQGGLWEFPGGKVEAGESVRAALERELAEELGIRVLDSRPLIRVAHDYGDRRVVLDTWLVTRWTGSPEGREGQPLKWVELPRLDLFPMPAADRPIVTALRLPELIAIMPPEVKDEGRFLEELRNTLEAGIRLVQFRVFNLTSARLEALAREAAALCRDSGARMLVNGSPELALKAGAQGVHLSARQLMAMDSREGLENLLVGASCHDLRELQRAESLGIDFALLSPVLPTTSHPDATPLGWERFSHLVQEVSLPVYALGGLRSQMLEKSWQAGAQGIAGITGLWNPR